MLAQDEVAVEPHEWDRDPDLLVFNNGTLDLRSGQLGPFQRDHLITRLVRYDYKADAQCPLFTSVLTRLMGAERDPASAERMVDALQIYFGYSLTGHVSAKAVFMLIGPKDTGKDDPA